MSQTAPAITDAERQRISHATWDVYGSTLTALSVAEAPAITTENLREHQVGKYYHYYDGDAVRDHLLLHADVADLLLAAIPPIEAIFGPGAIVTLHITRDQESSPTLSARIKTGKNVDEARLLRKRFYSEWWMSQPGAEEGQLTFNVDFG